VLDSLFTRTNKDGGRNQSVDTGNHIMDKHNIKSNYRQALEENTLMRKSKQTTNKVAAVVVVVVIRESYSIPIST
jgi:hypothetical protein